MDDNKYEIEIVTTKTSIQHSVKSKLRAANQFLIISVENPFSLFLTDWKGSASSLLIT